MSTSNSLKVLMLMHEDLIPPADATKQKSIASPWKAEFDVIRALKKHHYNVKQIGLRHDINGLFNEIKEWKPDIAFNLLEEFADESTFDQNIISFLEILKVPYTGCGPRGLIIARDKALAKKLLSYHKISVPRFAVFRINKKVQRPRWLNFPLIVKSLTEEASLGISQASVVYDEVKLIERVQFIHESIMSDAIVESYIEGKELYVGILGNQHTQAFPVWELVFKNPNSSIEYIATERVKWNAEYRKKHGITTRKGTGLTEVEERKIQKLCKRIYNILDLNGYARIDLRVSNDGKVYFIEANPNPNIEEGEDFAESALKAGVKYHDLIKKITQLGLSWQPVHT